MIMWKVIKSSQDVSYGCILPTTEKFMMPRSTVKQVDVDEDSNIKNYLR